MYESRPVQSRKPMIMAAKKHRVAHLILPNRTPSSVDQRKCCQSDRVLACSLLGTGSLRPAVRQRLIVAESSAEAAW